MPQNIAVTCLQILSDSVTPIIRSWLVRMLSNTSQSVRTSGQIDVVADLAKLVRGSKNTRRLLFRGQNVDKSLLPKLFRIAEDKSISNKQLFRIEQRMLDRLQKESVPLDSRAESLVSGLFRPEKVRSLEPE